MDAKRCDRCKKFYLLSDNVEKRPSYAGVRIFDIKAVADNWNTIKTYGLCADCVNAFMSWIKMGESDDENSNKSLCNSCVTKGCMFQSGIVRSHCDFYTEQTESEEENGTN